MTPNTLRARLDFSFKGESYEFDTAIDLDRCSAEPGEAPNFHLLLAKEGGIDPYSYPTKCWNPTTSRSPTRRASR